MFIAKRWKKPLRGLIRWQAVVAFVMVTVISVNVAVTGDGSVPAGEGAERIYQGVFKGRRE